MSNEAAATAVLEVEARGRVEARFPGARLMGGLSPSDTYVDLAPGVVQSIEANRERWAETQAMLRRGERVQWKWGL